MGITAGVAAHYLPELIGQLRFHCLATVHVVMTPAATRFVSPANLPTIIAALQELSKTMESKNKE